MQDTAILVEITLPKTTEIYAYMQIPTVHRGMLLYPEHKGEKLYA